MAFPPYTQQNLHPGTCAAYDSISTSQESREEGFYKDRKILPCDSYLGVTIFTTGFLFFAFLVAFYTFFFSSVIETAITEFTEARWTNTVRTLYSIRSEIMVDYKSSFSTLSRWRNDARLELWTQYVYFTQMSLHGVNATARLVLQTLYWAFTPIAGLFSMVYTVGYNLWFFLCQVKAKEGDRAGRGDGEEEDGLLGDFKMTAGFSQDSSSLAQGRGEHSVSLHSQGGGDNGNGMGMGMGMGMSFASGETMNGGGEGEGYGGRGSSHMARIKHSIDTVNATDALYALLGWIWSNVLFKLLLLCLGNDFFNQLEVRWVLLKQKFKGGAAKADEKAAAAARKKKKMAAANGREGGRPGPGGQQGNATDMGVRSGKWRKARSLQAKFSKLLNMNKRILAELRESRSTFTSDHALCITVFDTVIDSTFLVSVSVSVSLCTLPLLPLFGGLAWLCCHCAL